MDFFSLLAQIEISGGGIHICTPSWNLREASPSAIHRLYWCHSGEAEFWLGQRPFLLKNGWTYLIPGGHTIRYSCPRQMKVSWIHFQFSGTIRSLHLSDRTQPIRRAQSELSSWQRTIQTLSKEKWESDPRTILSLEALIIELLAGAQNSDQKNRFNPRLTTALEFLDRHYLENPSLRRVAEISGYHPITFHRMFQKIMKVTLRDWIEQKRMHLARSLLTFSAQSVTQIAESCGYGDVYHFSRVFRRVYGLAPGIYRQRSGQLAP